MYRKYASLPNTEENCIHDKYIDFICYNNNNKKLSSVIYLPYLHPPKPQGSVLCCWWVMGKVNKLHEHIQIQVQYDFESLTKQVRKCNRKLFKGDRSHIRNTAERLVHGYQRFDKVLWNNVECFVFGRRKSGYFSPRKLDGTKVHASAKQKEVTLLERASTLLTER